MDGVALYCESEKKVIAKVRLIVEGLKWQAMWARDVNDDSSADMTFVGKAASLLAAFVALVF
jgi:hypothetical protein